CTDESLSLCSAVRTMRERSFVPSPRSLAGPILSRAVIAWAVITPRMGSVTAIIRRNDRPQTHPLTLHTSRHRRRDDDKRTKLRRSVEAYARPVVLCLWLRLHRPGR